MLRVILKEISVINLILSKVEDEDGRLKLKKLKKTKTKR